MKTYLVANWKANKTQTEALAWLQTVSSGMPNLSQHINSIICLPFIHLHLHAQYPKVGSLGVQDLSPYPNGAYTGAISAQMLASLVSYCLVGHSERRKYFHETTSEVALKVTQALASHITPIVAITPDNWLKQLNAISSSDLVRCLIMYEPPEAISKQVGPIGEGEAAPLQEVIAAIEKIKEFAPRSPVLYGGSIKSHNIKEFLSNQIIDGVVPGSASLNAEEWLKLIGITQQIRG